MSFFNIVIQFEETKKIVGSKNYHWMTELQKKWPFAYSKSSNIRKFIFFVKWVFDIMYILID